MHSYRINGKELDTVSARVASLGVQSFSNLYVQFLVRDREVNKEELSAKISSAFQGRSFLPSIVDLLDAGELALNLLDEAKSPDLLRTHVTRQSFPLLIDEAIDVIELVNSDLKNGSLRLEATAIRLRKVLTLFFWLSKLNIDRPDLEESTWLKFLNQEARLRRHKLDLLDLGGHVYSKHDYLEFVSGLLFEAGAEITSTLPLAGFTNGRTAFTKKDSASKFRHYAYQPLPYDTHREAMYLNRQMFCGNDPKYPTRKEGEFVLVDRTPEEESIYPLTLTDKFDLMMLVRKNARSLRLIGAQTPMLNVAQNRILQHLERSKIRTNMPFLDWHDQGRNRQLAMRYGFCTTDASAYTDSIPAIAISTLLKHTPNLCHAVFEVSPVVTHKGNRAYKVTRLLTMGNACTFPLETVFSFAVVLGAFSRSYPELTLDEIWSRIRNNDKDFQFTVYGDDIITPSRVTSHVKQLLGEFGIIVNESKSFNNHIGESCGIYALRGRNASYDITPIRFSYSEDGTPALQTVRAVSKANQLTQSFGSSIGHGFLRHVSESNPNIKLLGSFTLNPLDNSRLYLTGLDAKTKLQDSLRLMYDEATFSYMFQRTSIAIPSDDETSDTISLYELHEHLRLMEEKSPNPSRVGTLEERLLNQPVTGYAISGSLKPNSMIFPSFNFSLQEVTAESILRYIEHSQLKEQPHDIVVSNSDRSPIRREPIFALDSVDSPKPVSSHWGESPFIVTSDTLFYSDEPITLRKGLRDELAAMRFVRLKDFGRFTAGKLSNERLFVYNLLDWLHNNCVAEDALPPDRWHGDRVTLEQLNDLRNLRKSISNVLRDIALDFQKADELTQPAMVTVASGKVEVTQLPREVDMDSASQHSSAAFLNTKWEFLRVGANIGLASRVTDIVEVYDAKAKLAGFVVSSHSEKEGNSLFLKV